MTRKPLMLSDTTMLLLREYAEMRGARPDPSDVLKPLANTAQMDPLNINGWRLSIEIPRSIWYQWVHDDIPVIRHLEWHLVLNEELMRFASQALIMPDKRGGIVPGQIVHPFHRLKFLNRLELAYWDALALRNQG